MSYHNVHSRSQGNFWMARSNRFKIFWFRYTILAEFAPELDLRCYHLVLDLSMTKLLCFGVCYITRDQASYQGSLKLTCCCSWFFGFPVLPLYAGSAPISRHYSLTVEFGNCVLEHHPNPNHPSLVITSWIHLLDFHFSIHFQMKCLPRWSVGWLYCILQSEGIGISSVHNLPTWGGPFILLVHIDYGKHS